MGDAPPLHGCAPALSCRRHRPIFCLRSATDALYACQSSTPCCWARTQSDARSLPVSRLASRRPHSSMLSYATRDAIHSRGCRPKPLTDPPLRMMMVCDSDPPTHPPTHTHPPTNPHTHTHTHRHPSFLLSHSQRHTRCSAISSTTSRQRTSGRAMTPPSWCYLQVRFVSGRRE